MVCLDEKKPDVANEMYVFSFRLVVGRVSEPACFGAAPAPEDIAFLQIF